MVAMVVMMMQMVVMMDLHLKVHKMLRLLQNPRVKVHKTLRLPRNPRVKVCHEICTSRCLPRNLHIKVHKILRLPRNLHWRSTKYCACHEISTSRFTSCSPAKAICSKSTSKDNIKMPNRSYKPKSHDSPRLPRNQSTPKTTAMSMNSTAPARKSVHRHEATHEQSILRLPLKMITESQNARGTTARA